MDGNPSAKCISSPTGDVESDAEGDNDTISHHMNSDPGIPRLCTQNIVRISTYIIRILSAPAQGFSGMVRHQSLVMIFLFVQLYPSMVSLHEMLSMM